MKITFKTVAIAASLCSALVLAPASFAGCDGSGNQSGFNSGQQSKGPHNSEQRLAKLTKRLELTESQQAEIKVLQAENQAQNLALKPAMQAYREQVDALISGDNFDEAAFTELRSSNQDIFTAKALLKEKHKFAMKNVLTEEQYLKYEMMKKKRAGKGKGKSKSK